MTTPLSDNELNHLLRFVGYGSLDADVWFLGMEEGGGGESNIRARLKFKYIEDCAEAHRMLGIEKHHWGKKVIQPTWRGMAWIMLALEGKATSKEDIRDYQANALGRHGGRTLLAELMPIPKPSITAWGYEQLIPQFTSRTEYYRAVLPRRLRYLRDLLNRHTPSIVACYGKSYWTAYKQLFPDAPFGSVGQFQIATVGNTLVLLTDHFAARTMNNKFADVVSIIKDHTSGRS